MSGDGRQIHFIAGAMSVARAMLIDHASSFWQLVTDSMSPQEVNDLAEDLGIEFDTAEHTALERGPLCSAPTLGKRKR